MAGTDHGLMKGMDMKGMDMKGMDMPSQVASATVNGTVKSVMAAHRMVNIDREAIVDWDRPAANVDFLVSDSVDIALFAEGTYVMFTFEERDGDFVIVSAMKMTAPKQSGNVKGGDQ